MSFSILVDFDKALIETYGEGVAEIVVSERLYNAFVTLTKRPKSEYNDIHTLSFYAPSGLILITKSKRDEIKRIKDQIQTLQERLKKLDNV